MAEVIRQQTLALGEHHPEMVATRNGRPNQNTRPVAVTTPAMADLYAAMRTDLGIAAELG